MMAPLYRVTTAESGYSESSLETVQEIEVSRDSMSTCDDYSPGVSSGYSASPDTPSSMQTTFTISGEPWNKKTGFAPHSGGIPANDWGYDLYHADSRSSEAPSLTAKSVKPSSIRFGFARKKSIGDLTPTLAQLEPFKVKTRHPIQPTQPVPLTLNQLDIMRSREVHREAANASRQHAPHQSRLATLARFGHSREQVTGAVKLVVRKKSDEGEDGNGQDDVDAESIFTTITTTSTSSGGSDIVPVYGRGGAGRKAGAKVTTQTYGSIDELCIGEGMQSFNDLQYLNSPQLVQSCGSSTSGISGGRAFLGRMQRRLGGGSDSSQRADDGSDGSGPSNTRRPRSTPDAGSNLRNLAASGTASKDSLATMRSLLLQATTASSESPRIVAYGRGGASRKTLAEQEKRKKVEEEENVEKPKSRAAVLMGRVRKSEKNEKDSLSRDNADVETVEAMPAYGRGGFARKGKH